MEIFQHALTVLAVPEQSIGICNSYMIHSSTFYAIAKKSNPILDSNQAKQGKVIETEGSIKRHEYRKVSTHVFWEGFHLLKSSKEAWDRLRKKACKLNLKSLKPSWHYFTTDMYDIFCSPFWLLECELSDFKRHFRQLLTSRLSPEKLLPPVKLLNLSKASF